MGARGMDAGSQYADITFSLLAVKVWARGLFCRDKEEIKLQTPASGNRINPESRWPEQRSQKSWKWNSRLCVGMERDAERASLAPTYLYSMQFISGGVEGHMCFLWCL